MQRQWWQFPAADASTSVSLCCRDARAWVSRHWRLISLALVGVLLAIVAAGSYYLYLARLYLLDEVHSVDRLRELTMEEKFTIRVAAPEDAASLHAFVLHYSVCPSVHEIQVLWHSPRDPPKATDFKYSTTHSRVTFFPLARAETVFQTYFHGAATTRSLLMLDADVFVSCADLAFTQSVWRSSQVSAVGYFPRALLAGEDEKGRLTFTYRSPGAVLWSRDFSLLLGAGLMLSTSYLQNLSASVPLAKFMASHPQCVDYVLPLWARSQGAPAPIWAEASPSFSSQVKLMGYPEIHAKHSAVAGAAGAAVSPTLVAEAQAQGPAPARRGLTESSSSTDAEPVDAPAPHGVSRELDGLGRGFSTPRKPWLDAAARSECVTDLARLLGVTKMPASHTKAQQARNVLTW